jgi:hypothetical protein
MSDAAGVVVLIGRILFAYFFGAVAGVGHFKRDQMMRGYAQQGSRSRPSLGGSPGCGSWLEPCRSPLRSGPISDL